MSWTKIDDAILINVKMDEAGEACPLAAQLLWFKALVYTNQQKFNGFVPKRMVAKLLDGHKLSAKASETLVSVGLWHVVDDGFLFHKFETFNNKDASVHETTLSGAERAKRFREKQREDKARAAAAVTDGVTGSVTVSVTGLVTRNGARNAVTEITVTPSRADACAAVTHSVPSIPLPPSLPPSVTAAAVTAEEDGLEEPTAKAMFAAYTDGVNRATGLLIAHARDDRAIHALSSVWGMFGYAAGQKPAEFLENLTDRAEQYARDAIARKQSAKYEANYAPHKFLAWLQATNDGDDPFPRAPIRKGQDAPKAGQESALPNLAQKLAAEAAIVPAAPDDPARLAFFEAMAKVGT